jgi:CIC family chloride channel protein
MLQTAVGGAGLAVAFNAPIGGALFTLEEVTKSFRLQTVLATVFAAATAVGCSRLINGDHPDFALQEVASPSLGWLPLFVVFGLATGCVGVLYNRLTLAFVDRVKLVSRIPSEVKAAVIGALIGLMMFIHPLAVGGGDALTQSILGGSSMVLPVVIGLLALRFVAGPLSYAAAVPGGLFAPLLAVGALWGVLFVGGFGAVWPADTTSLVVPMAIVGMGAFFAATVRAPVTAIVLVVEMTATTSVIVPMLAATAAAVLAAELLRSPPIYDSLRERMPAEPGFDRG